MVRSTRRAFLQGSSAFLVARTLWAEPRATPVPVWYCPAALTPDHMVRADYVSALTNEANWTVIAPRTSVLKFFIEAMTPSPQHLSDDDLRRLVALCAKHHFDAAFEVGGVRMDPTNHGPGSGVRFATKEADILRRWEACGGQVDYITTDNAVMNTVSRIYQRKPSPLGPDYKPAMHEIIQEAAAATGVFSERFPQARIGATESLGYFEVVTDTQGLMGNLDPASLPTIRLDAFLDEWLASLSREGVSLDHFHIDFGYEAVSADGKGKKLNFNRVATANKLLCAHGITTGLMIGAFDRFWLRHTVPPSAQAADESAVETTRTYLDAFLRANIPVNEILFDRWEPYPDRTGPASDPDSDMGLTQYLIRQLDN